MEVRRGLIEQSFNVRYSCWVREALDELPDSFTMTDPCISGNPIVYASIEFLKMFGYSKDEVIGKNGRIFQGINTSRRSVMEVREAIREERAIQVNLLNYKKNGTPFWMLFHVCPVFNKDDGSVIHFVGVQIPILNQKKLSSFRNGINMREGAWIRDVGYRYCRRDVCSDSAKESIYTLSLCSALVSEARELEVDETCEISEVETIKSTAAINNILSVLTQYSELTGRVACGKRCCPPGILNPVLYTSLCRIKQSFVLTDPCLPGLPIVYASDDFLRLTGFARHEVLGHNCRFFSGSVPDPAMWLQIKECIKAVRSCTIRILSYRKNKTSFWNFLHMSPVRNGSGNITIFCKFYLSSSSSGLSGQYLFRKCCLDHGRYS